ERADDLRAPQAHEIRVAPEAALGPPRRRAHARADGISGLCSMGSSRRTSFSERRSARRGSHSQIVVLRAAAMRRMSLAPWLLVPVTVIASACQGNATAPGLPPESAAATSAAGTSAGVGGNGATAASGSGGAADNSTASTAVATGAGGGSVGAGGAGGAGGA